MMRQGILKKAARRDKLDIHRFYQPILRFFRRKRIQILFDHFEINRSIKVLDLGGNRFFWDLMMSEEYETPTVIVVNLESHSDVLPEFMTWVVADGRKLPFKDNAFDLVFCNSVIEHVGDRKNQEALAGWLFRSNRTVIPFLIGHLRILSLSKPNIFQSVRLGKNIF